MELQMWFTEDGTLSTRLPSDAIVYLSHELRMELRSLSNADLEALATRLLAVEEEVARSYERLTTDLTSGGEDKILPIEFAIHSSAKSVEFLVRDLIAEVMTTPLEWRWDRLACVQFALDQIADERKLSARAKRLWRRLLLSAKRVMQRRQ